MSQSIAVLARGTPTQRAATAPGYSRLVGVWAFLGSLRDLGLVPSKRRCLLFLNPVLRGGSQCPNS